MRARKTAPIPAGSRITSYNVCYTKLLREIKDDDPLAAKFSTKDGAEYRLGDPIVSGKTVSRFQVKRMSDDQFDLHVTLTGADNSRWLV